MTNRALVLVSVASLCGACSSGDGGSNDGTRSGGSGGAVAPDGSGAGDTGGSSAESPPAPPLTVTSISPEDGASNVPLDAVIELRFSAALDPATASASNIVVQGPSGPLEGELTIEGEVARFAPASELPLLSPVRVSLGTALTSSEGGTLVEPVEARFQSRDGVFREPEQINRGGAVSLFLRGNDAGDLIATWTDLQVTSSVEAIVFDAALGTWTEAQSIEDDDQLPFSRPVAAVAPNGESIVAWRGGGWARYASGWSTATVDESISLPSVALGNDAALSVSNAMTGASYQLLPSGVNDWSTAQPLLAEGQVDAVDTFGGGFIAVGTRGGELVAGQLSEAEGEWSDFVALGTVRQLQRSRLATHGDTAAVAWLDLGEAPSGGDDLAPPTQPAARVFTTGEWSAPAELPEGAELPWLSVAPGGRALAVWTHENVITATSYAPEQGWSEPEELAEQSQLTPVGAIDGAGNLLALWPSSQQIAVQRRGADGSWAALEPLDSQVTVTLWSHVDRQGRVSVVWQNGSGIWWTRFE